MPVLRLLLALVLLAGPVLADTNSDVRAHFKKGQMHYALGEFQEAIGEFREAYRLKQEPAILFNLAQTYRQLHEWQHAYFHYRQYLIAKPTAPNRAEVEEFIEQMKNRIDEEDRAARADFNQHAGAAAASSPRDAATAPPVSTAQTPPAPAPSGAMTTADETRPVDDTPAPQPSVPDREVVQPSAAPISASEVATSASSGTPTPPASRPETAAAAAATQQPPTVVASPEHVPAAAAPKAEVVEPSPGPLVVEKHVSAWRYTGYAMIGVGLVAGGVAYAMHSSAQSAADQFNGKYQAGGLTAADTKLRDDAQSKGNLATESLIAGLALVTAGGALTIAF